MPYCICMTDLATKLRRAKAKLLGTAAADIVVPFQLSCSCGRSLSGLRTATSQQLTCGGCGQGMFVLPVNVYPATRRVSSEVVGGSFGNRLAAATREFIPAAASPATAPDRPDTARSRTASSGNTSAGSISGKATSERRTKDGGRQSRDDVRDGSRSSVSGGRKSEGTSDPLPRRNSPAAARRERPGLIVSVRRTFTPFRLLMMGVVLAAGLTGWWTWRKTQQDAARDRWIMARDLAEEHLKAGRLGDLQTALQQAVDAAEMTGRYDSEAQNTFSLLMQTQAVNDLSLVDLYSELSSMYSKPGSPDVSRSQTTEQILKDGWHLFQCRVQVKDEESSTVQLELPMEFQSDSATDGTRIQVMSSPLSAAAKAMKGDSLILAARIESCQRPASPGTDWVIRLIPESCTLMTSVVHCEEVGLPVQEQPDILQQLQRQQEFVNSTDLRSLALRDQERRRQMESRP